VLKGRVNGAKLERLLLDTRQNVDKAIAFLHWQLEAKEQFTVPSLESESGGAEAVKPSARHIAFATEQLIEVLQDDQASYLKKIFAIKKECRRYQMLTGLWQAHFAKERRRQLQSRLKDAQSSVGSMCRVLKGGKASPITRIRTKAGTATANPAEIDLELQKIWKGITRGNLDPEQRKKVGPAFLSKYGEHFAEQEECKVANITIPRLREGIKASPDNSPGLDGVLAADLRMLSDNALHWLAQMYMAIERGAQWPEQAATARTAWLDKTQDETPSLDPLDYR
jgi:hypothetical protein